MKTQFLLLVGQAGYSVVPSIARDPPGLRVSTSTTDLPGRQGLTYPQPPRCVKTQFPLLPVRLFLYPYPGEILEKHDASDTITEDPLTRRNRPVIIPTQVVRDTHDRALAALGELPAHAREGRAQNISSLITLALKLDRIDLVLPHRDALVEALQRDQDPDTGMWTHEDWHVPFVPVLQRVTALHVLDARPVHPVRELERILSSDDALRDWVEGLNWSHPWGGATGAGHSLIAFTYSADDLGLITQAQLGIIRSIVETGRDDVYGAWHRDHLKTPEMLHLGGAFAQGIVYARFGWPLDRVEGTVKMLEELQLDTGSWNAKWPAGSADMDAAWMLDRYTRHDAALRRRATAMLERCADYTLARLTDPEDSAKASVGTHVNLLSVLRALFPDPNDDLPPWKFIMFGQLL